MLVQVCRNYGELFQQSKLLSRCSNNKAVTIDVFDPSTHEFCKCESQLQITIGVQSEISEYVSSMIPNIIESTFCLDKASTSIIQSPYR
jgi:hypothetical protein